MDQDSSTIKRILIVRTDRIGDLTLTLPLAGIIKKKLASPHLSFLVSSYAMQIAESSADIDCVIEYKKPSSIKEFLSFVDRLKRMRFDAAVIVHPDPVISLALACSGIKIRIGSGYRLYSFLYNEKIFEHRKYGLKHELKSNIELLVPLGINCVQEEDIEFNLEINEETKERVYKTISDLINPKLPILIMHPGSRKSARDLPKEKFIELIKRIDSSRTNIVLTGSSEEFALNEEIASESGAINLSGLFELKELMALISLSKILVSNSTGPIHIAAALGKWCIGFYPKIPACSALRWGPYTDKKHIFTPEINCRKCTQKQCAKLNCMNSINTAEASRKINQLLEGNQ